MRLLLVEDNPLEAELATRIISAQMVVEVRHVTTAADALAVLLAEVVDIVLLDLNLPDAHEMEVLSILRSVNTEVPIVVLTGTQGAEAAGEAMRRGADDFLLKGIVTGEELLRSLQRCAQRRHAEAW